MAIQANALLVHPGERAFVAVIAMNVREHQGGDASPRGACTFEPGLHLPWTEAGIDEDAMALTLKQTRIAGTAAGKNGKAHTPYLLYVEEIMVRSAIPNR